MAMTRISRVLIANRGEIACRIIKTAKRMGIETVAVYSEADKDALHVKMASQAYCIGPAPSQQSYLRADHLLKVAQKTKSQAIHPGYGFLSENFEFARLCKLNNVIFIGPPESAIRDMGIKNTSKSIMEAAGVPIVKGYHGDNQEESHLLQEAIKIGFPVMIKANRGGGGKGMRISWSQTDFSEQLKSAKREALKSFNDDAMLLEKFVETPRHVEVQVFGDNYGNYVHLCERDCSVQRRHQKIIEEAPGPGITPEIREKLGSAAVKAAAAVGYVGAGTVEFIMDPKHDFYFMEMNTRLQVEHPITEMITGTDLVEWQLRVAGGERLPVIDQCQLTPKGHAFEARIYAEDCSKPDAFMPTAGRIQFMRTPDVTELDHVRIDTGVVQGDEISVHYDPMIAKLIVWSHDRSSALQKLTAALKSYHIVGLPTNIDFLRSLSTNDHFFAGQVHTDFIKQHSASLFDSLQPSSHGDKNLEFCRAAVVMMLIDCHNLTSSDTFDTSNTHKSDSGVNDYNINNDHRRSLMRTMINEDRYSPFSSGELSGFRLNHDCVEKIQLVNKSIDDNVVDVIIRHDSRAVNRFVVESSLKSIDNDNTDRNSQSLQQWTISGSILSPSGIGISGCQGSSNIGLGGFLIQLQINDVQSRLTVFRDGLDIHIFDEGGQGARNTFTIPTTGLSLGGGDIAGSTETGDGSLHGISPMPGIIEKIFVKPGQSVNKGDSLLTLIAMKMEYTIRAGSSGVVQSINVSEGQTVAKNTRLVEIK